MIQTSRITLRNTPLSIYTHFTDTGLTSDSSDSLGTILRRPVLRHTNYNEGGIPTKIWYEVKAKDYTGTPCMLVVNMAMKGKPVKGTVVEECHVEYRK